MKNELGWNKELWGELRLTQQLGFLADTGQGDKENLFC